MIAKELWPQAFVEGKEVSDTCLRINREQKKYVRVKDPHLNVTDRELTLSAAIQCFWQFKLATDAGESARVMIWNKVEVFIERELKPGDTLGRKLLKQVRRARNKDQAAAGFLAMWGEMEAFLQVATTEEFWKQNTTTPPWEIVGRLKADLEAFASGEKKNGTQRESDLEGSGNRIDAAADAGTPGEGVGAGPGARGHLRNVSEGTGSVEASEGGTAETN